MDLYHIAVFVNDITGSPLAAGCDGWGGPARTIDGQPALAGERSVCISGHAQRLRTANPQQVAVWVEDMAPGLPIYPLPGDAWHHVAVWCSDLKQAVHALEDEGYRREVAGGTAEDPAIFAYMTSEAGPRLELSNAASKPGLRDRLASEVEERIGPAFAAPPGEPYRVLDVAVVVSDRSALESLQTSWGRALGTRWQDIEETSDMVRTADGDRRLHTYSASTVGDVSATIIAPSPDGEPILAPVAGSGWHHVTLGTDDFNNTVTRLRGLGFVAEFHDIGADGLPLSFAMMAAPGGTRFLIRQAR
jgi:catechol 2,3-dioxygenase-like lactoylglutathione lyase family enzyme